MDEQRMTGETGDKNAVIDQKLRQFFDGKIVRKDLTKKIKEGANVSMSLSFCLVSIAARMIPKSLRPA